MKASIKDKLLLILGSTFLLILVALLVYDVTRRGIYNDKMGFNVAVVGDYGVSMLILRPEDDVVGWVKLPQKVRVKIYNSEAHYPLESVWNFGVSEKDPFDILEKSLGQSMGVVVPRAIKVEDNTQIENVLSRLLSISLKTDMSIRDRLQVRQYLADAVKSKKVLEMSLPETVFDKVTDPDGAEFKEFNQTMGLWTKNKFVMEPILDENADVSINNVSGVSGAGNILANQLESAGMHIVELKANAEEKVEGHGCVYSSDKRYEMTELLLVDQVECTKITKPELVESDGRLMIWVK